MSFAPTSPAMSTHTAMSVTRLASRPARFAWRDATQRPARKATARRSPYVWSVNGPLSHATSQWLSGGRGKPGMVKSCGCISVGPSGGGGHLRHPGARGARLRRAQDVEDEEGDADRDRGVGHVEVGPLVLPPVDVDEVHD